MPVMRIVIALGPFLSIPPAPAGAVERIWVDIAKQMALGDHQVTVICRHDPVLPAPGVYEGVHYDYVKAGNATDSIYINIIKDLFYAHRVARRIPDCDVVMINSFWLPILADRLRQKARCVVYNVQRMPKRHFRWYGKLDGLLAVSQATRQAVCALVPALCERTVVVPNPINVHAFFPPSQPRQHPAKESATILFTGRVHPEKGLHVLIQAFAHLHQRMPSLRLRIIGPHETERGGGGDAYLNELRELAQGLPVEFVPPIYDRDALRLAMHQAHVYCYPSLAEKGETFGVAPLEAMATGLPVVVSKLDCFADFVDEGQTGLVFDHRRDDPALALAEQLNRLLNDQELYERISKQGAARSLAFSNEAVADLYLKEFTRLLGQPR